MQGRRGKGAKGAKEREREIERSKDAHFPWQIALALSAVSARDEPNFNDYACLLRALICRPNRSLERSQSATTKRSLLNHKP
jgi:hypothetical protein